MVTSAQAERRLAFVAGIDRYPSLPATMQLERAVADAEAVGDALGPLGFQVTRLTGDVSQATFLRRFRIFAQSVKRGDTALFFFSGHGIGLDGANYLLPADVPDLEAGDEPLIRARAVAEADPLPLKRQALGLARVCRVWGASRALLIKAAPRLIWVASPNAGVPVPGKLRTIGASWTLIDAHVLFVRHLTYLCLY
jgi:Caspase domain